MVLLAKTEKKCHFGKDVSAEIRTVFGSQPAPLPQFCLFEVGLAELGGDEAALLHRARQVLSPMEMATWQAFRFPHRQREWLAGRLAVKEAVRSLGLEPARTLDAIEIGVDSRGKPFLTSQPAASQVLHVAISHSADQALGLASPVPCALDFQEIRSSLARVEAKFVRADERHLVQRCHAERLKGLGLIWAAKEALRKHVELWPLLGFLESALCGVGARGDGLALCFQVRPVKRALPAELPTVLTTLHDDKALALILASSPELGRSPGL